MRLGSYEKKVLEVIKAHGGVVTRWEHTHTDPEGHCWVKYRPSSPRSYADFAYHRKVVERLIKKGVLLKQQTSIQINEARSP